MKTKLTKEQIQSIITDDKNQIIIDPENRFDLSDICELGYDTIKINNINKDEKYGQ